MVPGEVVRAAGRIYREVFGNEAINWSRDSSSMLEALVARLFDGTPLLDQELVEASEIAKVWRASMKTPRESTGSPSWP